VWIFEGSSLKKIKCNLYFKKERRIHENKMQIHRLHLKISFIVLSVKGINQLEIPTNGQLQIHAIREIACTER